MNRTRFASVLVVSVLFCLISGLGWADEKDAPLQKEQTASADLEELAKLSGKDLYRLNCKGCHDADSPHGEYAPMSLIQEQWEQFFEEQYLETHQELADSSRGTQKVIELITPEMLEKIRKFCIDGAADSEQPMTCG
jgi:hypothetical protein